MGATLTIQRVERSRFRVAERGSRGLATGRNEDLSLPAANSREIPWQSPRAKRVSNEIDSRDLPRTYNFVQSPIVSSPRGGINQKILRKPLVVRVCMCSVSTTVNIVDNIRAILRNILIFARGKRVRERNRRDTVGRKIDH